MPESETHAGGTALIQSPSANKMPAARSDSLMHCIIHEIPEKADNSTKGSWGKASASTLAHGRYKPQPFQADHQPPGFAGKDSRPEKPVRAVASELTALLSLPFHAGLMALYRPSPVPKVMLLEVPLPPLSLQKGFAARVSDIRAMQAEQAASRRRLDDLFQSMLHCAFNGEL